MDTRLVMECRACNTSYLIPRNDKQEKLLTHKYGEPCEVEEIHSIKDIDEGDIIFYEGNKRVVTCALEYYHSAVVAKVEKEQRMVSFIDMMPNEKQEAVVQEKMLRMDLFSEKYKKVLRYLPKDALSPKQTVTRAKEYLKEKSRKMYSIIHYNCQTFANSCKCGIEKSEDVERFFNSSSPCAKYGLLKLC